MRYAARMLRICSGVKPRRFRPSALMLCGIGRLPDRHHVRRHVARHGRVVGDERVRADLAELVDGGEPAHDHPVAEVHVAAERRVVGEDALVADDAVVRDVRVGHEEVVVADARDALVLLGAAIERHEFADHVAVADLEPGRLAAVLLVLRRVADGGELEDAVVRRRCASGPR